MLPEDVFNHIYRFYFSDVVLEEFRDKYIFSPVQKPTYNWYHTSVFARSSKARSIAWFAKMYMYSADIRTRDIATEVHVRFSKDALHLAHDLLGYFNLWFPSVMLKGNGDIKLCIATETDYMWNLWYDVAVNHGFWYRAHTLDLVIEPTRAYFRDSHDRISKYQMHLNDRLDDIAYNDDATTDHIPWLVWNP